MCWFRFFFKFYAKSAKEFLHVTERELKYDFFEYKHFSIIKMLAVKTSHFWQLFSMNIRIFERTLSQGLGTNWFILISKFLIRWGESFYFWFMLILFRSERIAMIHFDSVWSWFVANHDSPNRIKNQRYVNRDWLICESLVDSISNQKRIIVNRESSWSEPLLSQ